MNKSEILAKHIHRNTAYSFDNIMSVEGIMKDMCKSALDAMEEYLSSSTSQTEKEFQPTSEEVEDVYEFETPLKIMADPILTRLKENPNHITKQLNRNEEISYNSGFFSGFVEGYKSAAQKAVKDDWKEKFEDDLKSQFPFEKNSYGEYNETELQREGAEWSKDWIETNIINKP